VGTVLSERERLHATQSEWKHLVRNVRELCEIKALLYDLRSSGAVVFVTGSRGSADALLQSDCDFLVLLPDLSIKVDPDEIRYRMECAGFRVDPHIEMTDFPTIRHGTAADRRFENCLKAFSGFPAVVPSGFELSQISIGFASAEVAGDAITLAGLAIERLDRASLNSAEAAKNARLALHMAVLARAVLTLTTEVMRSGAVAISERLFESTGATLFAASARVLLELRGALPLMRTNPVADARKVSRKIIESVKADI
jgi:hypothetical protein